MSLNNPNQYPMPVCPFYKGHENNCIKCKSPIPDTQCVVVWYQNKPDRDFQMHCFCNNVLNHKRCEIYRAVMLYGVEAEPQ